MAHADDAHAHAPLVDGDDLPAHVTPLEEPRSPAWLPWLGLAFLGVVLVLWLSSPTQQEEDAAAAAAASASASASAAPSEIGTVVPPASAPPAHAPTPHNVPPGITVNPNWRPPPPGH